MRMVNERATVLVILSWMGAAAGAAEAPGPPDFSPARRVLEEAIRERAFPGCAAVAGTSKGPLWVECLGRFDYDGGPPVTAKSLYDLASLTKVVGTTSVVLALVRDGKLALEDPVAKHLPEFRGGGRERVRIDHLLTHSSGLPAWRPLYQEASGHAGILALAIATPLEAPPGTRERYSDLGFIILGEVAARAGGKSLPDLERELVFGPLGLTDTMRNPPASELARTVPTEVRPAPAGSPAGSATAAARAIRGTVHDENAAAAGGLTGHAGLFSTAGDVSLFAAEWLRGRRGESPVFPHRWVARFTSPEEGLAGSTRALGWAVVPSDPAPASPGGPAGRFGPGSFGHTGFTGTSIWIDPDRDLYLILLSNRVHPTRENARIGAVRRELADAVVACLEGKRRRI
jgi:CubicO group peptidase (beta-lactamase class C family)